MKWFGVVGIVVVAMTAGCSADHGAPAASSTTAAGAYGCSPVQVDKWAATATRDPAEPTLRLPQPRDWKRVNGTDSDVVRLVLRDDNLGKQLPPSAVVTIADATGQASNPQAVIDAERRNLNQSGATEISDTPGNVCGFTATTFGYKTDRGAPAARSAKTVVVAPEFDNKLFDVMVTVQAGDAGDQAYLHDAQTILTGMEIKTPIAR